MLATAYTKRVVSDFYRDLLFFCPPGRRASADHITECSVATQRALFMFVLKSPRTDLSPPPFVHPVSLLLPLLRVHSLLVHLVFIFLYFYFLPLSPNQSIYDAIDSLSNVCDSCL